MEIPATLYFSCWSLISITYLALGFKFLDEEKVRVFPPLPMFFFKRFLAISVVHSSAYRRDNEKQGTIIYCWISFAILYYPIHFHLPFGPYPFWPVFCFGVSAAIIIWWWLGLYRYGEPIDFLIRSMMLVIGDGKYFPACVLGIAAATAYATSGRNPDNRFGRPVLWSWNGNNVNSTVQFAVAMFGSILFQQYVKFTSFHHVVAFLFFVGAWIGCLALLMSPSALGIFDFLLSNVMVGCTVNEFGLRGATWFAYFATVILFFLHRKLEYQDDAILLGGLRILPT